MHMNKIFSEMKIHSMMESFGWGFVELGLSLVRGLWLSVYGVLQSCTLYLHLHTTQSF